MDQQDYLNSDRLQHDLCPHLLLGDGRLLKEVPEEPRVVSGVDAKDERCDAHQNVPRKKNPRLLSIA